MTVLRKLIILLPLIASSSLIGSQAKEEKIKKEKDSEAYNATLMCPTATGKLISSPWVRKLAYECLTLCGHKNPESVTVTNMNGGSYVLLPDIINFDERNSTKYSYGTCRAHILHEAFHIINPYTPSETPNTTICLGQQDEERRADKAILLGQCGQCAQEAAVTYFECAQTDAVYYSDFWNIHDYTTLKEFILSKKIGSRKLILKAKKELSNQQATMKLDHPSYLERALRMYNYSLSPKLTGKLCKYHLLEKDERKRIEVKNKRSSASEPEDATPALKKARADDEKKETKNNDKIK